MMATPPDLAEALRDWGVLETFEAMSPSHRKEWLAAIDEAKRPQTRKKRIQAVLQAMRQRDRTRRS